MTCNNCQCNSEEVAEFISHKPYSIGEFFKIKNEVFKVVNGVSCQVCEFNGDRYDPHYCASLTCGYMGFKIAILYDEYGYENTPEEDE